AESAAADRDGAVRTAYTELRGSVHEAMQLVSRLYEEGGGRATQEWERFRVELDRAAHPVREKLSQGREQTAKRLRRELPSRLDSLCADARENALKKLRALRKHGQTLYWQ